MSNQIVDGDNANYVQYWLNQSLIKNGQYTIGKTTTYNISLITPAATTGISNIIGPIPMNTAIAIYINLCAWNDTVPEVQVGGFGNWNGVRSTGNLLLTPGPITNGFGSSIPNWSITLTATANNSIEVSLLGDIFGLTYWTGTVSVTYSP